MYECMFFIILIIIDEGKVFCKYLFLNLVFFFILNLECLR